MFNEEIKELTVEDDECDKASDYSGLQFDKNLNIFPSLDHIESHQNQHNVAEEFEYEEAYFNEVLKKKHN